MPMCSKCQRDLPSSAFAKPYIDKKGRTYERSYCKECNSAYCSDYGKRNRAKRNTRLRNWRKRTPTQAHILDRRGRLRKKYGLSPEQYGQLKEEVQGKCSLCGRATDSLELDHDHETEKIRGFLCRSCNLMLGLIEGRNITLEQIATYLDKKCHADILLKALTQKGFNSVSPSK